MATPLVRLARTEQLHTPVTADQKARAIACAEFLCKTVADYVRDALVMKLEIDEAKMRERQRVIEEDKNNRRAKRGRGIRPLPELPPLFANGNGDARPAYGAEQQASLNEILERLRAGTFAAPQTPPAPSPPPAAPKSGGAADLLVDFLAASASPEEASRRYDQVSSMVAEAAASPEEGVAILRDVVQLLKKRRAAGGEAPAE